MKIYWSSIIIFSFLFVQTISFKLSIFSDLQLSTRSIKNSNYSSYEYETKFFDVPLDHFSFSVNKTFKIKYLINDTWQQGKNPPIFFYTGNEGLIEVFAQNSGFIWDIAPEYGALLVFAEHRYYGESMPFERESYFSDPKYLGYLNTQQALADFVDLISFLRSKPNMKYSPVIVFGGSYGGMLSAWLRIKYPHVVQGAIASSAPILQFRGYTDCGAFAKIVTSDFERADPTCPKLIQKAWSTITDISSNNAGRKWLSTNWNLCKPLVNTTDVTDLKNWLVSIYQYLAMVDYPYETDFVAPLPPNPISAVCKHLKNPALSGKPLLLSLFKAISVFTNHTGETKCHTINDAAPQLGASLWEYQSCTEMVMPMCANGITDLFEPTDWNEKKYSNHCYKKFKVRPQFDVACKIYGCFEITAASNIVFSNGLLDPWSSGGVMKNVSSTAVAYIIPDAAHHLELRGQHPNDPFSVRQARDFQRHSISKWIEQYQVIVWLNTLFL